MQQDGERERRRERERVMGGEKEREKKGAEVGWSRVEPPSSFNKEARERKGRGEEKGKKKHLNPQFHPPLP